MAVVLAAGKLPGPLLARLLRDAGPMPSEVLIGPALGEDACAIGVEGGVLVAATDPVTFSGVGVGRSAVIVNANDVAVAGVRPRWFLATVLLPEGTTEDEVERVFADIGAGLALTGTVLVGGHTEITSAVTRPVVVGQMLGMAPEAGVLATGAMQVGDVVVQVGSVPVEGASVLATEAAERLRDLDPLVLRAAVNATHEPGICVVDAALYAAGLGATALHDPTEGGLAAALHELAGAAGVGLLLDPEAVQWFAPGTAVCEALGADPWATLASGALLASFAPSRVGDAVEALVARGHPASVVAVAVAGEGIADRSGRRLPWPERDEVARVLEG